MRLQNHIISNLGFSLMMGTNFTETGFVVLGSVVPDIIDFKLSSFVGIDFNRIHRTVSHYWILYVLIIYYSYTHIIFNPLVNKFIFYTSIGALLHIVTDAFSIMGVPILNPFRTVPFMKLYRYNSLAEFIIAFIILMIGLIYFLTANIKNVLRILT